MNLIDTHTHIYLEEFDNDRAEMMERARLGQVNRMYLPNIDSSSIAGMMKLEEQYPGICYSMMGLHPCSVNEGFQQELSLLEEWLGKRSFAAVGEIGLDYYWDQTYVAQQKEAFQLQINWALQYDLPIVIHSRNSMQDCIDLVAKNQNGNLKGIFHCFGGSTDEAKQIMDLGFLMGIGGVITYKKSGLADVVKEIPLDYLVLETDAPYLTPVPHRGKRNEPSYLHYIVDAIASAKNCMSVDVISKTTENALNLFGQ